MKNIIAKLLIALSIFALLLLTVACEEDPIAPQEEHLKAIGMVFYSSGIEIARIEKGITSDTLIAPVGSLSDHIDIKFIAEDGTEFTEDPDAPQTLAWEFENPNIADIWQHEGEEGSFEFHLKGLQVGETNVEFFAMHNDHHDYRSGNIPVKTINVDSTYGTPIGLEIIDEISGSILASVNNSTVIGQLSVTNSDTTNHMVVNFFDSNNRHFQPTVPPYSLLVEVGNESIISITGQSSDEPWAFKIIGEKNGETTITIKLMDDGNVEQTFEPITVKVN